MIYAIIDEVGAVTGFYDSVNGDMTPDESFVAVSREFQQVLMVDFKYRYIDAAWEKLPIELPELKEMKAGLLVSLKETLKKFLVDYGEGGVEKWIERLERQTLYNTLKMVTNEYGVFLNKVMDKAFIQTSLEAIEEYEHLLDIWEQERMEDIFDAVDEATLYALNLNEGKPTQITITIE